MDIPNTEIYCSLPKNAMKGLYRRHQEHDATTIITDDGGGRLRICAVMCEGSIEFTFKFKSAKDMRAIARVFLAAAELRDAIEPAIDVG